MDLRQYLDEYALSHQHPINVNLHNICVPVIAWSSLGFSHSFYLFQMPASYVCATLTLVLYALFRNIKVEVFIAISMALFIYSYSYVPHLRWVCVGLFLLGWMGQLLGHKLEEKKPSFTQDLVFLLIGPIWVWKKFTSVSL
jgi:uncharacterized membrane protein YGL010W